MERLRVNDDTQPFLIKSPVPQSVILPDGTQPLVLGSGSIAGLLGVGGMSNVYKIWNPQLELYRAVKLMKPDLSLDARQRFQTEIKITAALSHPNIIEIHSVGEWNSLSFIEMEFIDGETLAEVIAKKGALPMKVCTALGILVTRALAYAHEKEYTLFGKTYRGLIHRDLKTSNIMIARDGRVKLMDFGIARPIETSLLTMDGAVMGTMQYLAPEQIDGKNVGVAADLYALGAILYETITGRKAFPQKNLSQLMSAKTANIFVPLRFFKLRIPKRLKTLAARCMHLDPGKRPSSANDLLAELEEIHRLLTDELPEQVISRFVQDKSGGRVIYSFRRQFPVMAVAATIVIALFAGIGVGFFISGKNLPMEPATIAAPAPMPVAAVQPMAAIDSTSPQKPVIAVRKTIRPPPQGPVAHQTPAPPINAAKPQVSYLAGLEKSTGLSDPIELMSREAGARNFAGVLRIYSELSPMLAAGDDARLLKLRALFALGKMIDVADMLKQTINDGEFYQIKARFMFNNGDIKEALALLEKSTSLAARQIDASVLRRDYLYYRALCLSRLFEKSPTEEYRKNALDGWFEVKNALRQNPEHAYFRKAVAEMQKIGNPTSPAKG
jgi:tRNA A-37 threonylcarbamoyl transferase component Bud32